MTNKEDENAEYDPGMTALLAVHLVSQVLDEAYVIANTAKETGQSWQYLSMMRNIKCHEVNKTAEDITDVFKGDGNMNENKIDDVNDVVATSTPQKTSGDKKGKIETANIGQGDQEFENGLYEMDNSTSMFIHELFDMSEVEQALLCEDSEVIEKNTIETNLNDETKTWDSHNNTAFNLALELTLQTRKLSDSGQNSDFSLLAGSCVNDMAKGEGFNIVEDDGIDTYNSLNPFKNMNNVLEVTKHPLEISEVTVSEIHKTESELNEDIYLTLNRDDEPYSDDYGEPVLQDPKGMVLLDIELKTTNTSDDNVLLSVEPYQVHDNAQKLQDQLTATVISSSSLRKRGLMRRCRNQGARLLSCLRGWWRSKSSKHKGVHGKVHGICPLSPDTKRRAATLMDERLLRSPTPTNNVTWKFNTINEASVSSNRWKDYTYVNETDEYDGE